MHLDCYWVFIEVLLIKRWWNDEVTQAKKAWAREKMGMENIFNAIEELKKAQNAYYHVIRKAKRECWQNF